MGAAQPRHGPSRARIGWPVDPARRDLDRDTHAPARSAPWSGKPGSRACARGVDGRRRRRVNLPPRGGTAPSPPGNGNPTLLAEMIAISFRFLSGSE